MVTVSPGLGVVAGPELNFVRKQPVRFPLLLNPAVRDIFPLIDPVLRKQSHPVTGGHLVPHGI